MASQSLSTEHRLGGIEIIIRRLDPQPVATQAEARPDSLDRLGRRFEWPVMPPTLPSVWNGYGSGFVI